MPTTPDTSLISNEIESAGIAAWNELVANSLTHEPTVFTASGYVLLRRIAKHMWKVGVEWGLRHSDETARNGATLQTTTDRIDQLITALSELRADLRNELLRSDLLQASAALSDTPAQGEEV